MTEKHDADATQIDGRPNDQLVRYIALRYEPQVSKELTLVDAASQVEGTDFP